ncbi:hypothetical protein J6590_088603 [Homalodisca vitripennis]|nr:hypothetical protein J6590_088603 [Homalodisca vitripennis]
MFVTFRQKDISQEVKEELADTDTETWSKVVSRKKLQPQQPEDQAGKRQKKKPPKKSLRKRPTPMASESPVVAIFSSRSKPPEEIYLDANATVRVLEPKWTLQMRGLDELTTEVGTNNTVKFIFDLCIEDQYSITEDGNSYPGCQKCGKTSSRGPHQDWVGQVSCTRKARGL